MSTEELKALRKRVKLQRAELRRLNKIIGALWEGFTAGLHFKQTTELRGKMIDAFGWEAVRDAEHPKGKT